VLESQSFDRLSAYNVGVHDFIHISQSDSAVPHSFRVNHHVRTMLALVEASGLVCADTPVQAALGKFLLELLLQLRLASGIATSARMPRRAHVSTDENVALEFRHRIRLQGWGWKCEVRSKKPECRSTISRLQI